MAFPISADQVILFPTRDPVDPEGAVRRACPWEDGVVECYVARSPGCAGGAEPRAFMLEFTGNASRAEYVASYVANRWGDHPVETWVANYPGYGGSTGPARLASIPPAAVAAYDSLARVAGDRPIILAGNSLGCTAALYVATQRPAAGLILQNPPPLQDIILRRFGWWNMRLLAGPVAAQVPAELNAMRTAPRVTARAVFLLAGADTIVPPKFQREVVEAYAGPKRLIELPDADHNDPLGEGAERELAEGMGWLLA